MAFETNKFNVTKKTKLPAGDFSVECNVSVGSEIGKILSVGIKATDENYETLNGVLNYSGNIDLKLVFLTTDGEINSSCHTCNFSSKFESDEITTGTEAVINVNIIDYSIESISGDSLRIVVNLSQNAVISQEKEIDSVLCNDEDVCSCNEEIEIVKLLASKKDTFYVESETMVKNIKKILCVESQVILKNAESGVNFVAVQGEVVNKILYLTDEDKFESFYINEAFKEEIEVENAARENLSEVYLKIKEDGVSTQIENDEQGQKVCVKVPVMACIYVYQNEVLSVVKDLYSTKNEINIVTESFQNTVVCPSFSIEEKIEGSLTLDDEALRVDKVLFYCGNGVNLTNVYVQDDKVFVEGIAKTNVVYLNDETNSLNSVQVDVPFSFNDKIECDECENLIANAVVTDVDVVVKKGRDLYYDAKVKVNLSCSQNKISAIISQASVNELLPERDYAMEVLFAQKEQNAWDIAKTAHVTVEQILAQNPELVFPLEEDANVILYYKKN